MPTSTRKMEGDKGLFSSLDKGAGFLRAVCILGNLHSHNSWDPLGVRSKDMISNPTVYDHYI